MISARCGRDYSLSQEVAILTKMRVYLRDMPSTETTCVLGIEETRISKQDVQVWFVKAHSCQHTLSGMHLVVSKLYA